MNYRKHGLKALGLSFLALLGLMAFAASGAQASGKVLVENLNGAFTVGITGTAENALTSRLLILTINMEIFCHSASVSNGLLNSSGHGSATITFETCLAQGVKTVEGVPDTLSGAVCTLENIVANVLALVILHSGNTALTLDGSGSGTEHKNGTGQPYILFTPKDGLTFALIENKTKCALPEHAEIKGCVVAKVENPNIDEIEKLITTKAMLNLFGCVLRYGANVAHLDADAMVKLANDPVHGNHSGLKWGVE